MSERKSPTQSATLYKIGTKKKGNDGNIWIIVENKNNIKKWQLYKKPTKIEISQKSQKPIKLNDIPIEQLYEKIDFKKNNWNKWLENCTPELKSFVNKIRKSYTEFKKLKLKVIEVIEPPSKSAHWIEQYPSDYAEYYYPKYYEDYKNIIPHIIIRFKIDFKFHLHTEYKQICIESYIDMSDDIKEKLIKYLDKKFIKQYSLRLISKNYYSLDFCLKDPKIKL
jgi:hypothetical protein